MRVATQAREEQQRRAELIHEVERIKQRREQRELEKEQREEVRSLQHHMRHGTLRRVATRCTALQHVAPRCNMLQPTLARLCRCAGGSDDEPRA